MNFRTEIKIQDYPFQIDYQSKIFGMGSCFIENIQSKLDYYQFQILINPFGVIFNPVSIRKMLGRIVEKDFFTVKDLFFHNDMWKSYDLHSKFNNEDKEALLNHTNRLLLDSLDFLKQTDFAIFTLGTAWVYKLKSNNACVSNCHKVAQSAFDKGILSPTEIIDELFSIIKLVRKINPDIKILFTLSPVRHLRDGFIQNQQSKAHLLTAIHQIVNNQNVFYFPSYEIMMDDLRDYRFYKNDFLHPNDLAIDYIWQLVCKNLISPKAYTTMEAVSKIRKSKAHKAFNKNSDAYQKHLRALDKQIQDLQKSFPWMQI